MLVACEFSARVRDAFRARGHDAVSCDVRPTEGDPSYHLRGDVREHLESGWDLIVAFPPCTYLTSSNAWRWAAIEQEREHALELVRAILAAPAPRIALENPQGAINSQVRKPDQVVHPWQFGDPFTKRTGLWLKGLPPLRPEATEPPPEVTPWVQAGYGPRNAHGQRTSHGVSRGGRKRGRTFPGIARAMAEQWAP